MNLLDRRMIGLLGAIVAAGAVVRLAIIVAVPHVDVSDLDNYFWAANQALHGANPYSL